MKVTIGIDLGSTTTKAVVLDEDGEVLGRGITNSRSNYQVACEVARGEALIHARFGLVAAALDGAGASPGEERAVLEELERRFRKRQYLAQLATFAAILARRAHEDLLCRGLEEIVRGIVAKMESEAEALLVTCWQNPP